MNISNKIVLKKYYIKVNKLATNKPKIKTQKL